MYGTIVHSLLDTDFYKLLMLQYIWKYNPDTRVNWAVTNRTKTVNLSEVIDVIELQYHLDVVSQMEFYVFDIDYLRSLNVFEEEFLKFLTTEFKLSPYMLTVSEDQFELEFRGKWLETSMWEIYALSIINELRNKSIRNQYDKLDKDIQIAAAKLKLHNKLETLATLSDAKFSDFSTRRRFSFNHQYWACRLAAHVAPDNYVGSSNVYISLLMDTTPIGTNAHEMPMVEAALTTSSLELKQSQYVVLDKWQELYPNRLIMLPDTFGTAQFLNDADSKYATEWTGIRVDSMDPIDAGELIEKWYRDNGVDPKTKTVIFSDGLDVQEIIALNFKFKDTFNLMFGWGTLFGNDFRDCSSVINTDPISIVCKVKSVNGRSAVKLSDNYAKAIGSRDEVEYYKKVFGDHKLADQKVVV